MYMKKILNKGWQKAASAALILLLASCSKPADPLDFKTPNDALQAYNMFLGEIKGKKMTNSEDFILDVKRWQNISDTVYHYLMTDSVFIKDLNCSFAYSSTHDSIRYEMLRLSETWRYSYDDVLNIKRKTSKFCDDRELQEAVKEASPFFEALDTVEIKGSKKNIILKEYRNFLHDVKKRGIHNKSEMLEYIKDEDFVFRTFLLHLSEMEDEPIADITQETEIVCRNIFMAAKNGEISARDAMVYMAMRTVRRLLQNSTICIHDFNSNRMTSKAQGNAYLWMIIQPFVSIDQFSIATLTPQERSNFNNIISQLPKSVEFAKTFGIDQRSLNYLLPQQLLKMYILTL